MFEAGKAAQVAKEMKSYKVSLLGLCETRCNQSGQLQLLSGQTVLYSGHENEDGKEKVGLDWPYPAQRSKSPVPDLEPTILVPRGRDPSCLRQESRPLAAPNFWACAEYSLCSFQPIRFVKFHNESVNRRLPVLEAARPDQKDRGLWGREWEPTREEKKRTTQKQLETRHRYRA